MPWSKMGSLFPPKSLLLPGHRAFKPLNSLLHLFVILLLSDQFSWLRPNIAADAALSSSRHTVAAINGDLVLGALFPVHWPPQGDNAQQRICGKIREQYGIQRVEAAFKTIDEINNSTEILPNITLGIEIRDSCWNSPIALEQSIEFIRDAMAASDERADVERQSERQSSSIPFMHANPGSIPTSPLHHLVNSVFQKSVQQFNTTNMCPRQTKKAKNIVGVVGPASSTVTIQVQNLLQLFNIPQVGYSATSKDLSHKDEYHYFLRVVPSDELQARVMAELIKSNDWNYIGTAYTEGNYGSSLHEVFKDKATEQEICIAHSESLKQNEENAKLDEYVAHILRLKSVKVIVCACEGLTVKGLLGAIGRANATGKLLLLGSDGWSDRIDVVQDDKAEAQGGLSIRIRSPYVKEFDPYYFNLNPFQNTRNPWFREFWENRFNCSVSQMPLVTSQVARDFAKVESKSDIVEASFNKTCTGNESLSEEYTQDTKLAFVIKAIWTMAYGLHDMQKALCPHTASSCPAMLPVNGSKFLSFLKNVTFVWYNETVSFDENGDPPGVYDIMNYQKVGNEYKYIHIAYWDSKENQLQKLRPYQWPSKILSGSETVPVSVCSKPCEKGYAKNIQTDSVKCCWVCVRCQPNQYLKDEYTCEDCPKGYWPNDNLTGCFQIEIEYIQWTETPSLVAIAIALIGFMMTLFTMIVFIRHNDTPVVKSSTRELSYMIMIGMFLCYSTTFALIAKPSKETCFITAVLPGFSFAVIYASLVTKTNRIARILAGSKKRIITKKPRFMSSSAQVVISLILILIECCIITAILIENPPKDILTYPALNRVLLVCNTTTLSIAAPLGFDFFLIAMCTVYAVKTRNVPENFNEAKFIGFTMYTTLVIWIAFIPIYFGSDLKVLTMCLCISFSAIVALILLFFPKLYIILFKPEKNNRSFFTTAKNVRCHIGYVPTLGISRHSSHSTSEFSVDSPRNHSLEVKHHHHNQLNKDVRSGHSLTLMTDKSSSSLLAVKAAKRKSGLNILERFRVSKQDKINANVQEKIRAVRAAEALDRQTNRRVPGRFPPRQSSSGGIELAEDGESNNKIKLLNMLKQALGEDLHKIPGLVEFIESARRESRRVLVESSAQTSYDLLEQWFPALRHRLPKNGSGASHGESDVEESEHKVKHDPAPSIGGVSIISKKCFSSRDKLYPMERDNPAFPWFDNSYASYPNQISNAFEDSKQISSIRADIKAGQSSSQTIRKRTSSLCSSNSKVRASEESLLNGANSCVIEESASSGEESSPSSGVVYKNIIINLGSSSIGPTDLKLTDRPSVIGGLERESNVYPSR